MLSSRQTPPILRQGKLNLSVGIAQTSRDKHEDSRELSSEPLVKSLGGQKTAEVPGTPALRTPAQSPVTRQTLEQSKQGGLEVLRYHGEHPTLTLPLTEVGIYARRRIYRALSQAKFFTVNIAGKVSVVG